MEWEIDSQVLQDIMRIQSGLCLDINVRILGYTFTKRIGYTVADLKCDGKVPKRHKKIYGMRGAVLEVSPYIYKYCSAGESVPGNKPLENQNADDVSLGNSLSRLS